MKRLLSAILPISLATCLAACGTPMPNHLVRLEIPGSERYALSTEDGVIALNDDDLSLEEVPMLYWYKASPVMDDLVVQHRVGDLGLLLPKTTRLQKAELAAEGPLPGENLYIQVIHAGDVERRPYLLDAHLYANGEFGDLLELDEWFSTCHGVAEEFAGAGVYAKRLGRYVCVGLINGMVTTNPNPSVWSSMVGPYRLLPYISLDGLAHVLPRSSNFFERRIRAFRPDYEHGLDREGNEPNTLNR
ncbi:MAG: hypothetical protein V2A76_04385 [Planctomycetota bacterium]